MAAAPPVQLVHALVPGRARVRVASLYRSSETKRALETQLPDEHILSARASATTATVLVWFDPALPHSSIVDRIERVLQRDDLQNAAQGDGHKWYAVLASDAVARLNTSTRTGLTADDARQRLRRRGPNILQSPPRRSQFAILLDQFRSLPVGLLVAAAALSVATGGVGDALVVISVIVLNAAIGFTTERKAETNIAVLLNHTALRAMVLRDGRALELDAPNVVPGDVLLFEPGRPVVADARIVRSRGLRVDESALTGESAPVEKSAHVLSGHRAVPLPSRLNMVFRGTFVTGGTGVGIVVRTGRHTEIGRVHDLVMEAADRETPLQRQLGQLGQQQVWFGLATCGAVLAIGVVRGYALLEMIRTAVALAVAAIPEGLPAGVPRWSPPLFPPQKMISKRLPSRAHRM